jgi:hypothetical protein
MGLPQIAARLPGISVAVGLDWLLESVFVEKIRKPVKDNWHYHCRP